MESVGDEGPVAQSAVTSGGAGKGRVLVIDGNRDLAVSCSWLLRDQGHEVEIAFDRLQALEVARAFRPDVALLDVGLPGIDGYELARRLRAEFGQDVLLIIITAYAQDNPRRGAHEASFDHHFVKPIDFEVITGLLA